MPYKAPELQTHTMAKSVLFLILLSQRWEPLIYLFLQITTSAAFTLSNSEVFIHLYLTLLQQKLKTFSANLFI